MSSGRIRRFFRRLLGVVDGLEDSVLFKAVSVITTMNREDRKDAGNPKDIELADDLTGGRDEGGDDAIANLSDIKFEMEMYDMSDLSKLSDCDSLCSLTDCDSLFSLTDSELSDFKFSDNDDENDSIDNSSSNTEPH